MKIDKKFLEKIFNSTKNFFKKIVDKIMIIPDNYIAACFIGICLGSIIRIFICKKYNYNYWKLGFQKNK